MHGPMNVKIAATRCVIAQKSAVIIDAIVFRKRPTPMGRIELLRHLTASYCTQLI
jgi:hypothetical protein